MLSILTSVDANAQENNLPSIDMNTSVKREVTPDEIYLRITINENDYRGRKTLEDMQSAMLKALEENGIDVTESLTLNYMGSEVSYRVFSRNMTPRTEASYMLKLHDAETIQKVIGSLEAIQISNIELSRTVYTKENELKSEMAIEAIQQAQADARTLATAIGQDIGKALSISSWMSGGQSVQPRLYRANAVNDAVTEESSSGTQQAVFNIGKLTYTFTVNVKFELTE